MDFSVWLANHSKLGQRSLEDVVGIVGHQLRALGHAVVWDESNQYFITGPGRYNLLVEGFTPPVVEIIAQYHAQGARFLCLATEEPSALGFNQGTQREMTMRQEMFPAIAPYLDGILHLVPGQHVTDWYGQFAPTAYVELGYAPTLVRRETQRDPPFAFGFYGSVSERRLKLLKKLAKRVGLPKAVRVVADFKTQTERDAVMQEAKVIVQLRKFDAMGLVSSSRCNTALCLGRPVVAEPHDLSKPWDEVIDFAEQKGDFVNLAMATLANWRSVHARQFGAFRAKFTPEYCVGRALTEIGLTPAQEPLPARARAA